MNENRVFDFEMFKFSCFSTNNLHHRSKKEISESAESMNKTFEDCCKDRELKVPGVSNSLAPLLEEGYHNPSSTNLEEDTSFSMDKCVKPGETHSDSSPEANLVVHQKTGLHKSQSLGNALDREGRVSSGNSDEFDQRNSSDPLEGIDNVGYYEDPTLHEEGNRHLANHSPGGYAGDPEHLTPGTQSITASHSLTNIGHFSPTSEDGSPPHAYVVHCYGSYEDLNALDDKSELIQNRVIEFYTMEDRERDDDMLKNGNSIGDDPYVERYGNRSYNNSFGKDWSMDGDDAFCKHHGEPSLQNLNALPNRDFKIKRIEEWVSMIDLGESSSVQDTIESSDSINQVNKSSHLLGSPSPAKLDSKSIHGMEAAKNIVSSLPATSTSIMLANHGLVVIPFLSAFVNLKTLNLSGNAIVRITSGSLPRGLHVLNLAKNNISTIEGLRELTRLRVLDLSYNRILRIGHGLASCSSLKELYLAGNKISEVEGLHRLLKLNVLDLRFNKISTTKCLGQLTANYSSLQAINLEGNPAQRNVGDEQLKKFLQNSLPHLVYYNKQTIKASTSKEAVDRSSRPAIASRQLERGLRSDHKLVRKGTHNVSSGRISSSSGHGYRSQAVRSPMQSRDRLSHLPPSGTKGLPRHHHLELGSKLPSSQADLAMRRSRSEGNLGGT